MDQQNARGTQVRAELDRVAGAARDRVDAARAASAAAEQRAVDTTAERGRSWDRQVRQLRSRPGASRADWRNDQVNPGS